jgi:hypothetical protein
LLGRCRLRKTLCEPCHSERSEESRFENPNLIGARFFVVWGSSE